MPAPANPRSLGTRRAGLAPDTFAPDGSEIRLLVAGDQPVGCASVCEVALPPGQVSHPVRHRTVEEIWYITSGAGRVWRQPPAAAGFAESTVAVAPGDTLTIPLGWSFQFAADAEAPLRFICYTNPPWPGDDEAERVAVGGLGPATAPAGS